VCVFVGREHLPKDPATVPRRPSSTSVGTFAAGMDTGGLIQKLSEFVAPSSEEIAGDLCRQHGRAYLHALHRAAGWAVKSK
jgi:hypothetical protein